jgi:hypothetical protein
MLKKNINNTQLLQNNIQIGPKNTKNYLFSTPYDKVISILKSIKDFISSLNNNKANEELDWVINILSHNLLYSFKQSSYCNKNIQILEGNHKIKDFAYEVEQYNKEYENFYYKYLQIGIKNEEMAKYISDTEKNICIINNNNPNNIYSNIRNGNKKLGSKNLLKKLKKSKKFFSQFSLQLLKDYNQIITGNNPITDIYYTESNGFSSKKIDKNKINSNENKKRKEISFLSPENVKNTNMKNTKFSLYNKYQVFTTDSSKNKINSNKNISSFLSNDNMENNLDNNDSNIINNNNHINKKMDKIISLPLIKFNNLNTKSFLENYKNNNKNYNLHFNQQKDSTKRTNNKIIALEQPNIPLSINNDIDIKKIFDYNTFNIFDLKEKLGLDNIMPFLGKEIIKKLNIYNLFETSKLDKFLLTVTKNYFNTKVLYHTSLHGVDVCYSIYMILTLLKDEDNKIINISEFDIASLVIASLCHDIGHPGLNNKFLINSNDELSIFYNNISVLENFHCAKTFKLLENDDINIFSNYSNEEFSLMRKKMIDEILATDMASHFKVIDEYKEYKKDKDKKLVQNQLNFFLHTADLSHNFRQFEISIKWVELLSNEFWNQGDKEKELGLPVSFLCDRNDVNVPKSQISFINTFILPIIKELVDTNKKFECFEKNANNNLNIWTKLEKEKRKRGWTPDNEKTK